MDLVKFIETNAVGFLVSCTSSKHAQIRYSAYLLLARFHGLVQEKNFRGKPQILLCLDLFRNGILTCDLPNPQKTSSVVTIFVAHALVILLNPQHYLYPQINKFLLQRPLMDLEVFFFIYLFFFFPFFF